MGYASFQIFTFITLLKNTYFVMAFRPKIHIRLAKSLLKLDTKKTLYE